LKAEGSFCSESRRRAKKGGQRLPPHKARNMRMAKLRDSSEILLNICQGNKRFRKGSWLCFGKKSLSWRRREKECALVDEGLRSAPRGGRKKKKKKNPGATRKTRLGTNRDLKASTKGKKWGDAQGIMEGGKGFSRNHRISKKKHREGIGQEEGGLEQKENHKRGRGTRVD